MGFIDCKSMSSIKILPFEGLSNPAKSCSKVLLPAPDAPVIANLSAFVIDKFIFSNNIIEINKGYAYLLTHPGIPMIWIYHYLFSDSTGALKKNIEELIVIRKSNNIHANSKVEVLETVNGSNGYYLSIVDDTLLIKIGDGNYQADEQWRVLKSEKGYTIWSK